MPAELIIGAAIGAAAASTRVRQAVRRGLIYGIGAALVAYDKVAAGVHAVARSARQATTGAKDGQAAPAEGAAATSPGANSSAHPVEAAPAAGTPS
jgi:hypothetical protein